MLKRGLFIPLLCLFLTTSCALISGTEPAGPQIQKGIPSSAYIFVHSWHNPEKDFLDPCYDKVFEAIEDSGIADAVNELIEEVAGPEESGEIEKRLNRYIDLVSAVDWKALVSDDFVFAVEAGEKMHYHTLLGRMSKETAAANLKAIDALFTDIAGLNDAIRKVEWTRGETRGVTLDFSDLHAPASPTAACNGEVMVLSTARDKAETAIDLVFGGETEAVSLVDTEKFRETFKKLPAPGDSIFYMEPSKIFSAYDEGDFKEIVFRMGPAGYTLPKLMHLAEPYIVMADRIASVATTKDKRTTEDTIEIPAADWKKRPVSSLFAGRAPVKDFDKLIPAKALSFSVSRGVDPTVFYDMLVGLFREFSPAMAEPLLGQWKAIQEKIGIRLRDDLLACFDGGSVSVSFPAARPNRFSSTDSVSMVRLKDKKKAVELFEHWTGILDAMLKDPSNPVGAGLAQANVKIRLLPVEKKGFSHGKKLSISVVPFIQPVFGFFGDYFVMASSKNALDSYLAFLDGKGPNILENADFRALAMEVPGGVRSVSFSDLGASLRSFGHFLSMSGMFTAMIPAKPETKIAKKVMGLAPYLGPILESLDFLGNQGKYSVFDGATGVFRSRKVIRYRTEETEETKA